MRSSAVQNGRQQQQQPKCRNELAKQDLKNPEERRHRYELLKNSVAVLRSRFRETPSATPCPASPSSQHNTALVPYFSYAPSDVRTNTKNDRSRRSYFVDQIEACSLLESYAMQALRLDCEGRLKEVQMQLEKVQEKLKDKVRRTELFDRELEKQSRKLERKIDFFSQRCRTLEKELAEQSVLHKEELWAQSELFTSSQKQELEEQRQQTDQIISNYEDAVATLKTNNDQQLVEIQRLKQELSTHLEQIEKNKQNTEAQLEHLDGQLKQVIQQSETFRMSYEEKEREWNMKVQHLIAMHQYQTKILTEDFEFQSEKLRKEMKDEREQQSSKWQAYKAQKLLDMENVEKRVKDVLEMKDATITKLKLDLSMLHQQLNESINMFDEDCGVSSIVEPV